MGPVRMLLLRHMKKYARARARIVALLVQPLTLLLALGFGLGVTFRQAGHGDFLQFLGPGIACVATVLIAFSSGAELIIDRQLGMLKEVLVSPVPRRAVMLGRSLGSALAGMLQGSLVLVAAVALGFRPVSWLSILPAVAVMFVIAFFFACLGSLIATRVVRVQTFQLISNAVVTPVTFLSGAFFPLHALPEALAVVVRLNPLSYGIDAVRGLLTENSAFGLPIDFTLLLILAAITFVAGSIAFSRMQVA